MTALLTIAGEEDGQINKTLKIKASKHYISL